MAAKYSTLRRNGGEKQIAIWIVKKVRDNTVAGNTNDHTACFTNFVSQQQLNRQQAIRNERAETETHIEKKRAMRICAHSIILLLLLPFVPPTMQLLATFVSVVINFGSLHSRYYARDIVRNY